MSDGGLLSPVHCFPFHCFPLRVGTMGTMEAMEAGGLNVPPAALLLPMLPGTVGSNGKQWERWKQWRMPEGFPALSGALAEASRRRPTHCARRCAELDAGARNEAARAPTHRASPTRAPEPGRPTTSHSDTA